VRVPFPQVQESRFQFVLKPDQINAITHVRDIRQGVALDYPVQLQLRFCVANTADTQADAFPGSFNVKLNAKPVPLPPPIPSNR
jgi:E3 SUMO-protein ligase PIAS2